MRAVFEEEGGEEVLGDWSDGLFFAVSSVPSNEEVAEAMRVLQWYVGASATALGEPDDVTATTSRTESRVALTHPSPSPKAVVDAKTAIRGALSDPVGEAYGVVAVVESPDGAGLAAANLSGGADLVLDGSSAGELDLLLDQNSLNLPSASNQTFWMRNTGGGMLNLVVEGVINGIGEGITNVDAAALGGLPPHMWANKEGLMTPGGVPVHWDNLADVPPDLADGDQNTTYTAGPGLALDGSELSAVWPGIAWGQHVVITLDSGGNVGYDPSITTGIDGLGLISYYDETNGDLKVLHCNDVVCSTATTSTVDSAGDVGGFSSITVGSDGLGIISYYDYDAIDGDLKVAHCSDVQCSSATITTIDSAGDLAECTSITVGRDGLGIISYTDETNDDLKVAHCNNVLCTSATVTTIDTAGYVGDFSSITIGSDGLGVVSYYRSDTENLKVAHCNNVDCSEASSTGVDSAGEVGWDTSITIGADGLPLVSYLDATNGDLKVVHCSNRFCIPHVRYR